jgi:hypothetical protein
MATGSVDFSATDKMTVWAGVNKQSDAAVGALVELSVSSAANNGTFYITAPAGAAGSNYFWRSKGTGDGTVSSAANYAAPISNVLTGIGDISGDSE